MTANRAQLALRASPPETQRRAPGRSRAASKSANIGTVRIAEIWRYPVKSLAGERLKIGNTNSRLRFGLDPAPFINAWCAQGPTHHCALGIGHVVGKLEKVAWLAGLELKVVGDA